MALAVKLGNVVEAAAHCQGDVNQRNEYGDFDERADDAGECLGSSSHASANISAGPRTRSTARCQTDPHAKAHWQQGDQRWMQRRRTLYSPFSYLRFSWVDTRCTSAFRWSGMLARLMMAAKAPMPPNAKNMGA